MNKFAIKENVDKIIYLIYNFLSSIYFYFRFEDRKTVSKNKFYRDIHKGERCFIFGTGPSLNAITTEQIECLKKEITFGVNSFYKVTKFNKLIPTYYSLFDDYYWKKFAYFFKVIHDNYNGKITFLTSCDAKQIVSDLNDDKNHILLYSQLYPVNNLSCNLEQNMHITSNVVSTSILIAIYMGFKEIYLLGCDFNSFAFREEVHSYDEVAEEEIIWENKLGMLLKFFSLITEVHYKIAKVADKRGVKIINLTEASLLDAYPLQKIKNVLHRY